MKQKKIIIFIISSISKKVLFDIPKQVLWMATCTDLTAFIGFTLSFSVWGHTATIILYY
jgi:hypothetical protein